MNGVRFDWYQATVQTSPDAVRAWARRVWPDADLRPMKPKNGAAAALQCVIGDMVVFSAIWGGGMEGSGVNLWASGCDAPFFSEMLRQEWPGHRVTRADACIDFEGPGAWEWGLELLTGYALRFGISTSHAGDYLRGVGGRTFYVGSRQSVVQVVLYEKGKQIPELGRPDLVRVEVRAKPNDAQSGALLAGISPVELFGCSRWSRELGAFLTSQDQFPRVVIGTRWAKSDQERARSAFLRQYSGILGEWASELGGWPELGEEIGRRIKEAAEGSQRAVQSAKASAAALGSSSVPAAVPWASAVPSESGG